MTAVTPETFAAAELHALGIPPTPADVGVVEAWEQSEGGNWDNDARYNPQNTTLVYDGSTPMGGDASGNGGHPVQAYRSWADGLAATIETLVGTKNAAGTQEYAPILNALADNDPGAAAQAIVDSPWGTSTITYGGKTYRRGVSTSASSDGAASQSTGGAQTVGLFGAHGWNPLAWPGQILDAGASGVWDQVQPFLVTGAFAVGAIALAVVGAHQLVQPTITRLERDAGKASPLAEIGAAL